MSLMVKEVLVCYEAFRKRQEPHLDTPRPYRDYITWLRKQDTSKAEAFWRAYLKGFVSPRLLGADPTQGRGLASAADYDKQVLRLSETTTRLLQSLAHQNGLTLNTLFQGAWVLLLARYSGQQDIVFGATLSGRPSDLPGIEAMMGLFINTLPVRVQVTPESLLLPWLQKLQAQQLEMRQYEHTPLAQIQGWSEIPGNLPLFESLLIFENYAPESLLGASSEGLELYDLHGITLTTSPLTILAKLDPELALYITWDSRRFDAATVTQMLGQLQTLLERMVANPDQRLSDLPPTPKAKVDRRPRPARNRPRPRTRGSLVAPRNLLEFQLTKIWEKVLGIQPIGVRDNFFELGGRSLLAVPLFAQIEKTFGQKLPLAILFQASTIEQLASILGQKSWVAPSSSLVAIQRQGTRTPFFSVHAIGGHVLTYGELAHRLGEDQPFYGLESPGRDGEQEPLSRMEDLAALYIKEIRTAQPEGPYCLGGLCFGGLVAFEMAQQLQAQGQQVALLALFDAPCPVPMNWLHRGRDRLDGLVFPALRFAQHSGNLLRQLRPNEGLRYIRQKVRNARNIVAPDPVHRANFGAARSYLPKPYPGRITYFLATGERRWFAPDLRLGWSELAAGGVETYRVPGTHLTILREPHVKILAEQLKACLDAVPPAGISEKTLVS
jgi:thioesterase domain-containing protein